MPRQTLKQRPDGRYRCKYKGLEFYGNTQSEALAARDAYKRMEEAGLRRESAGETVESYATRWLPVHKVGIRTDTYNAYAHYLNVLCAVIGDRLIRDVTPTDIKAVYAEYLGKSESTIKKASGLYKSLFDTAVADGLCRKNPCKSERAKPHKGSKGTHRAITDEERQLILTVDHRMRPAAMAMLYAGFRRGEVIGIVAERDIDFKANLITVRGAVHFENNNPFYEEHAKTDAGLRSVPLFTPLADTLKEASGLIVTSMKGSMCSVSAFRRGWESYMEALSNRAGHPVSIRAHDLRHSFCTMLRDAGVDLKIAIKWMGHADEKMILKIYDHITPEREAKAIRFVENDISGGQNGGQNRLESPQSVEK